MRSSNTLQWITSSRVMMQLATLLACCTLFVGCRTPWQINTKKGGRGLNSLLSKEESAKSASKSVVDEESKPEPKGLLARAGLRRGTPSPTARKTSQNRKTAKRKSPKSAIEEALGDSGLLTGLKGEKNEEAKRVSAANLAERKRDAQQRIRQEMERRRELQARLAEEEAASEAVHFSMSDLADEPEFAAGTTAAEGAVVSALRSVPSAIPKTPAGGIVVAESPFHPYQPALLAGEKPKVNQLRSASGSSGNDLRPAERKLQIEELGNELIERLEEAESTAVDPDSKLDISKKKRFVHLALGDLESAQKPIEGLDSGAQEYVRQTLQGLHDATDPEGHPSTGHKLSKALKSHRDATKKLASAASLELMNLAFCTEIDGFGEIKKFRSSRFRPDQQVLLYCELENFVSTKVTAGFQTRLQGTYEIVDEDGERVMEQLLPADTDTCAKQRRDFYIAYRFHLPKRIAPGNYRLRLVIEDMQGHKFGKSEIDFEIVD